MTKALLILALPLFAVAAPSYQKLTDACTTCKAIDKVVGEHNIAPKPELKRDLAIKLGGVIKAISLKGKTVEEQRREIYFAINGSLEVLSDDFDSQTVVMLMDLRTQSPRNFDYVFWRFPMAEQKKIAERMTAAKTDKIRPKATVPAVKEISE